MKKYFASVLILSGFLPIFAAAQNAPQTLDDFEKINWTAGASDSVSSLISQANGVNGKAIHMDYDFHNRAGYAFITRDLPINFPQEYEVSFFIRGDGPPNNLEFKFKDKSGDNVWWKFTKDFQPSKEWQLVKFKRRMFSFAWGPIADKTLKQTQSIDFVISAGTGGKGFIEIDDLKITPLPPRAATPDPIKISATSGDAKLAIDGNQYSEWSPNSDDKSPTLNIDLGSGREFGGISLLWSIKPKSYIVETSDNGVDFTQIAKGSDEVPDYDFIRVKDGDTKKIRIKLSDNSASLKEAIIEPLNFGDDDNEFVQKAATYYPKGTFPRGFSGQEEFWTLIGADGGKNNGLISEDGRIELGRGGPSIEPFVRIKRDVKDLRELPYDAYNWSNVTIKHELLDKYLPIPSAIWTGKDLKLKITGFANPRDLSGRIYGLYEITNTSNKARKFELNLLLRPLQVNGPKQFLAVTGGVSHIASIATGEYFIKANNQFVSFTDAAENTKIGDLVTTSGNANLLQANWMKSFMLKPNETQKFGFIAPLGGGAPLQTSVAEIEKSRDEAANYWRNKLNQVQISANGGGQEVVNAMKTNLAYILMMREGPMLKPGTRSYNRSWIRDGAMISETLLRMGLSQEAKDYLAWFTPYQFENGKIPCCADFRGSDPVPENDSHGEYIHLVKAIYDYTGDKEIVKKYWPNVEKAVAYINSQRALERSDKNETDGRANLYGLMPPTISHEGYMDKIAYSYWDDFWTLRGLFDASELAGIMDDTDKSLAINDDRYEFQTDLLNSIAATKQIHKLDYIPGAADRGDFDATSTTIALILGLGDVIDKKSVQATFDKYWANFQKRRDLDKVWKDYTPYEWRTVSAFTRLGQADRADAASNYFMNDKMPIEWNAFAEVVGREKREPRYLGDLPHGWVASDFINSSLDRFIYEDGAKSVILGAGMNPNWLLENGVKVENLTTSMGKFSFSMRIMNGILNVTATNGINAIIPKHLIKKNLIIFNGKKYKTNGGDFTLYPPIEMK